MINGLRTWIDRWRAGEGAPPAAGLGLVLAHDVAAATFAMWAAVHLRYEFAPNADAESAPMLAAALFAAACLAVFPIMGVHRGVWRFTDLRDIWRVLQALALANLLFLPVWFLASRLDGFPRSSLIIELGLAAALLLTPRVMTAAAAGGGWRTIFRREKPGRRAAVLVGGAEALDGFLRETDARPGGGPVRVRALVTLENGQRGRAIRGRRIAGGLSRLTGAIRDVARAENATPDVILVDSPPQRDRLAVVVEAAARAGAQLVRPHGKPGRNGLAPLDAADLLNRPARSLDMGRARTLITGRRVLVTGAGGTIGSELTRQIARLGPARLSLLDASEYNLYEIELELKENGANPDAFFGDVRDRARVEEVIAAAAPDVVLHAAALKHVPLMEANPAEAVLTNVLGTVHVGECARDGGASDFVLISTDKAVRPSNVMGASKRAAELFVQALDAEAAQAAQPDRPHFRASAVRFGNVLGSTGSVAPLFERQIARGGPITVTHPDITRYFMTTQEAAALVLQAGALSMEETRRRGGVFVLDMGEPVRIEDLARQLCRLRGLTPGVDIAIEHTGLRPGEKLHEDIFYAAEDVAPTAAGGVMAATAPMIPMDRLRGGFSKLIHAARRRDVPMIYAALGDLTPEFRDAVKRSAA